MKASWRRVGAPAVALGLGLALVPAVAAGAAPSASSTPAATTRPVPAARTAPQVPIRQLIVRTSGGTAVSAALRTAIDSATGTSGARVLRRMSQQQTLVSLGRPVSQAQAWRAARILAARADVVYAEPDLPVFPTDVSPSTPNDPQFSSQWDLWDGSITPPSGGWSAKAPAAWARGITGSSSVVVAVLDTGLTAHPDLTASVASPAADDPVVAGYDFVSEDYDPPYGTFPYRANDGDGRDPDPSDPGDWISSADNLGTTDNGFFQGCSSPASKADSSWHGTHVAGTIAARKGNGLYVAGIAPGVKVQPVRVLGKCGGVSSDIDDAITWASGGSVPGVPANPTPATVISMSLGGYGFCPASTQAAIDGARARGTTVVVAAGNAGAAFTNGGSQPADCSGVIPVVASTRSGGLASYSNYGGVAGSVGIGAPGGDGGGSILSTWNTGTTVPATPTTQYMMGTSMATPHVAAAVALLQSRLQTRLTPDQVRARLQSTSTPWPVSANCTATKCGPGILDIGALLPDPPGSPGPVVASASAGGAFLSWAAPAANGSSITGYRIRASADGGTFGTVVADTGSTATSSTKLTGFADGTPFADGTSYVFEVTAINGVGLGAAAVSDAVIPSPITAPATPAAPVVSGGVERLSATWTAPDDGGSAITGYAVRYRLSGSAVWLCAAGTAPTCATGSTATSATVAPWPTPMTAGVYEVQVAAINAVGTSVWSASATASVTALAQGVTLSSGTIRPYRDGFQDSVLIRVRSNRTTPGALRILDSSGRIVHKVALTTGTAWNVVWSGRDDSGRRVANGRYIVLVYVGQRASTLQALSARPTVLVASSQAGSPRMTRTPSTIYPRDKVFLNAMTLRATATVPALWSVRVVRSGKAYWRWTGTSLRSALAVTWKGRTNAGALVPAGTYTVLVTAKGGEGTAVTASTTVGVSSKVFKAVSFSYTVRAADALPDAPFDKNDASGGGWLYAGTDIGFAPVLPTTAKGYSGLHVRPCAASGSTGSPAPLFAYLDSSDGVVPATTNELPVVSGCIRAVGANGAELVTPSVAVWSRRAHVVVANLPAQGVDGTWHLAGFQVVGTRYVLV